MAQRSPIGLYDIEGRPLSAEPPEVEFIVKLAMLGTLTDSFIVREAYIRAGSRLSRRSIKQIIQGGLCMETWYRVTREQERKRGMQK